MITSRQDFWAGLLFLTFGILIFWFGRDYAMGVPSRMGTGFFPRLLAGGLCLVGLIVLVRAVVSPGDVLPRLTAKPLLVFSGVVAFGLLLKPAGLIVASLSLIVLSLLGGREFKIADVITLSVVLVPFTWFVFIWGLGVPMPLLPGQ